MIFYAGGSLDRARETIVMKDVGASRIVSFFSVLEKKIFNEILNVWKKVNDI